MSKKSPNLFPALFVAGLSAISSTQAASSLGVVATYDAAGAGSVSTNASGNALSSTLPNDVAGFTTNVAAAHAANTGGVIDFGTAGVGNASPISVTYGGAKNFNVTSQIVYAAGAAATSQSIDIRDNLGTLTPISGVTALLPNQAAGAVSWGLSFGSIAGGTSGEVITTAGFTLLSRSGTGQTATVNWFIDGSSTPIIFDAEAIANSNGGDNTFFSYTAPAGSAITGFRIDFGGSGATLDRRLGVDDIGFITGVIPEPASALLAGLSCLAFVGRRKR